MWDPGYGQDFLIFSQSFLLHRYTACDSTPKISHDGFPQLITNPSPEATHCSNCPQDPLAHDVAE